VPQSVHFFAQETELGIAVAPVDHAAEPWASLTLSAFVVILRNLHITAHKLRAGSFAPDCL